MARGQRTISAQLRRSRHHPSLVRRTPPDVIVIEDDDPSHIPRAGPSRLPMQPRQIEVIIVPDDSLPPSPLPTLQETQSEEDLDWEPDTPPLLPALLPAVASTSADAPAGQPAGLASDRPNCSGVEEEALRNLAFRLHRMEKPDDHFAEDVAKTSADESSNSHVTMDRPLTITEESGYRIDDLQSILLEPRSQVMQERQGSTLRSQTPESEVVVINRPKSMFDIHDETEMQEMYDKMTSFMESHIADDSRSDVVSDAESKDSDAAYEARRAKNMLQNQRMLAELGLTSALSRRQPSPPPDHETSSRKQSRSPEKAACGSHSQAEVLALEIDLAEPHLQTQTSKVKPQRLLRFFDDGTTNSVPLPGTVHEFAHVEVPSLRERFRFEYIVDYDFPVLPPRSPLAPARGQGRANKKRGIGQQDSQQLKARKTSKRDVVGLATAGSSPRRYSCQGERPGTNCHQCRKIRTDTVSCTNTGLFEDGLRRRCPLSYCRRCLEFRYGVVSANVGKDVETSSAKRADWSCPRCRAICNCKSCMIKAGLEHLLSDNEKFGRPRAQGYKWQLSKSGIPYESVSHYLAVAFDVNKIGKRGVSGAVAQDDREAYLIGELAFLKGISESQVIAEMIAAEDWAAKDATRKPVKRLLVKLKRTSRPKALGAPDLLTTGKSRNRSGPTKSACKEKSASKASQRLRSATQHKALTRRRARELEQEVWVKGQADRSDLDSDLDLSLDEGDEEVDGNRTSASDDSDQDSSLTSLSQLDSRCARSGESETRQNTSHEFSGRYADASAYGGNETYVDSSGQDGEDSLVSSFQFFESFNGTVINAPTGQLMNPSNLTAMSTLASHASHTGFPAAPRVFTRPWPGPADLLNASYHSLAPQSFLPAEESRFHLPPITGIVDAKDQSIESEQLHPARVNRSPSFDGMDFVQASPPPSPSLAPVENDPGPGPLPFHLNPVTDHHSGSQSADVFTDDAAPTTGPAAEDVLLVEQEILRGVKHLENEPLNAQDVDEAQGSKRTIEVSAERRPQTRSRAVSPSRRRSARMASMTMTTARPRTSIRS